MASKPSTQLPATPNLFTLQHQHHPPPPLLPPSQSLIKRTTVTPILAITEGRTAEQTVSVCDSSSIKNRILSSRQNRRKGLLRQQTSSNVKMYLRIKSQGSHYQFRGLKKGHSCQFSLKPKTHFSNNPDTDRLTQVDLPRCQSAKTTLLSRCTSLKQSIARDKEHVNSITDDEGSILVNTKFKTVSFRSRAEFSNKENEENNKGANVHRHPIMTKEAASKVIAHKLGIKTPNSIILINSAGCQSALGGTGRREVGSGEKQRKQKASLWSQPLTFGL